jgi:hypothetical protein
MKEHLRIDIYKNWNSNLVYSDDNAPGTLSIRRLQGW